MELSEALEQQVKQLIERTWCLHEAAVFGGEWSLARDVLTLLEVLSDYVS